MLLVTTEYSHQWQCYPSHRDQTAVINLFRHLSKNIWSTSFKFKRQIDFNVRTILLLIVFSQYFMRKMVECAWSNSYGPPQGSMSYAEWYALHEKHRRLINGNKSIAVYETTRKFLPYKSWFDSMNRTTKSSVLPIAFTRGPVINKPDVQRIRNKTTWKNNGYPNTVSKPFYPRLNRTSTVSVNKYKLKAVQMNWCEYVEKLFGLNKCDKSTAQSKADHKLIVSHRKTIKSKLTKTTNSPRINTVTVGIKRPTRPSTRPTVTVGSKRPIVRIEKPIIKYINTTSIPSITRDKIRPCSAASDEDEIEVEEEHKVGHSKFDICTGFYGKCSRSHSCESNVACLHRITHQPCCMSSEINQQCPSVDEMGYECRKLNPVNWCDMDEDCGSGGLHTQICCPTGCGYNTCLKRSETPTRKSFRKLSPRKDDCPSSSLIPVNCFSSRPAMQCTKADECVHVDERRRRCCKTSCGYSICMTRLTDRWLIT